MRALLELLFVSRASAQEVGHALGGLDGAALVCALAILGPLVIAGVLVWRSRTPPGE